MLKSISALRVVNFLILLLLLVCCTSTTIYTRGALFDLVLRPYPAYPYTLSNQRCVDKECKQTDVKSFDLSVIDDRKQLRDLKFTCNVAGERFGICHDSNGLCQLTKAAKRPCLFCERPIIVFKRLDMRDDFQFLVNSSAICAAQESFMGGVLF
jgi:hypothetical protein